MSKRGTMKAMEFLPARFTNSERLPWIPASTPGK